MSDDELFYLQPGFDLNSLTVPRLREILVKHDVAYPGSAKKPQLIQIVTNDVLPLSKKLLAQRARTKRTSKGITDVPSSQEGTLSDEDAELMPPPKTPRSRKSRSNVGGGVDTASETSATTRRTRTLGTRNSTAKHARQSDTETDLEQPQATARKTRKSVPGPTPVRHTSAIQIEEPERRVKRESLEAGESPFSDDNPFQSGSSPSGNYRRVSSTSRSRNSLGTSKDRRKSGSRPSSARLSTQVKQEDGITAPSRSTFEFPVSRLQSEPASDGVDVTEEFTPEEAQALQGEQLASGQLIRKPGGALVRRTKKKHPTSPAVKTIPWVIITALLAAVGGWYRNEKVNVGYCGVGQARWSLAENPHIPPWVHENLEPECLPCPQHGICFPDMEVTCENDYLLKPHPLSFGGVVPLPPTCEADGEKVRRIKVVADRAVESLRDRRAAHECGEEITSVREDGPATEEIHTVVKAGEVKLEIPEESLKAEVSKMRRKGMGANEFDDLWRSALGEIIDREEVEVIRDGDHILLSSSSLANLGLGCTIRRSLRLTLSRNRGPLATLILLVGLFFEAKRRVRKYRATTKQIPQLVDIALDRLATQAALKEIGRVDEAFISVGQLRDDVLRNIFDSSERERVWTGVRRVVETNSNIRAATREGAKTGEWSRVWEWIGPLNPPPGFDGRRAPGAGLMKDDREIEAELTGLSENGSHAQSSKEIRKWDEGTPIY